MPTKAEKRQLLKDKLRKKRASLSQQVQRRVRTKAPKISVNFK
jgi:hypothetical protein